MEQKNENLNFEFYLLSWFYIRLACSHFHWVVIVFLKLHSFHCMLLIFFSNSPTNCLVCPLLEHTTIRWSNYCIIDATTVSFQLQSKMSLPSLLVNLSKYYGVLFIALLNFVSWRSKFYVNSLLVPVLHYLTGIGSYPSMLNASHSNFQIKIELNWRFKRVKTKYVRYLVWVQCTWLMHTGMKLDQ